MLLSCGKVYLVAFEYQQLLMLDVANIDIYADTCELRRIIEVNFAHTVELKPADIELGIVVALYAFQQSVEGCVLGKVKEFSDANFTSIGFLHGLVLSEFTCGLTKTCRQQVGSTEAKIVKVVNLFCYLVLNVMLYVFIITIAMTFGGTASNSDRAFKGSTGYTKLTIA